MLIKARAPWVDPGVFGITEEAVCLLRQRSVVIKLTDAAIDEAEAAGKAISGNHNRQTDARATRVFSGDDDREHKLGCVGQRVVESWHRAFASDNRLIQGGDGGCDCRIDDKRVDIKYRRVFGWELQVREGHVDADFYVLTAPEHLSGRYKYYDRHPSGLYYILGYCTGEFIRSCPTKHSQNRRLYEEHNYINHVARPWLLRPASELLSILGLDGVN